MLKATGFQFSINLDLYTSSKQQQHYFKNANKINRMIMAIFRPSLSPTDEELCIVQIRGKYLNRKYIYLNFS